MDSSAPLVLYVIAHDNLHHLRNFISWVRRIVHHIVIVDNGSTYPPLLEWYLHSHKAQSCHIVRLSENLGPRFYLDEDMRRRMPERFLLSDPDLEPQVSDDADTIVNQLMTVSAHYGAWKVGCALHLWPESEMLSGEYHLGHTITKWEAQFWRHPEKLGGSENEDGDQVYYADVDTTFCLVDWSNPMLLSDARKSLYPHGWMNNYRVGGSCTMLHLPWQRDHWRTYPMRELQWYARTDGRGLSTTVKMLHDNGMIRCNLPTATLARRAFWLDQKSSVDESCWWDEKWSGWEPSWWKVVKNMQPSKVQLSFTNGLATLSLVTATLLIVSMLRQDNRCVEWCIDPEPDREFFDSLYRSEYWLGCSLDQMCIHRASLESEDTVILTHT